MKIDDCYWSVADLFFYTVSRRFCIFTNVIIWTTSAFAHAGQLARADCTCKATLDMSIRVAIIKLIFSFTQKKITGHGH